MAFNDKEDVAVVSAPRSLSEEVQEKGDDFGAGSVPQKYRGTEADRNDMYMLGKKQVLRVCLIYGALPNSD